MSIKYDANRVIKPDRIFNWTQEMVKEYAKCARSVKYFALHHCKVTHPVKGVIKLEPRDYQVRMLELIDSHRLCVYNCPRQIGKSTIIGLYALWLAMFADDDNPCEIWILSNKAGSAQSFLDDIKGTYEALEPYLKRGMIEYNKTSIMFDNKSSINTGATSRDTIRGESPSFLILDEFAHVAPHKADDFYTAVQPSIATGGKMCVISTPNGNSGKFYEIFTQAKYGDKEGDGHGDFWHFDMKWDEPPGRDEKFKKNQIKNSSLQEWNQEYEAKFLGSSKTLIDGDTLEEIDDFITEPQQEYEKMHVWEKPRSDRAYVISCDVSKGVHRDYSIMQILDVTVPDYTKQVATWFCNKTDPFDFADKIYEQAILYNGAFVIVENNTYGHEVCRKLWRDYNYSAMYKEKKAKTHGVTAGTASKKLGTTCLKRMIERKTLIIQDKKTYDELCNFVEVNPDIYKCEMGKHNYDDRVMALVWGAYLLSSEYWTKWGDYLRKQALGVSKLKDSSSEKRSTRYRPPRIPNTRYNEEHDLSWLQ